MRYAVASVSLEDPAVKRNLIRVGTSERGCKCVCSYFYSHVMNMAILYFKCRLSRHTKNRRLVKSNDQFGKSFNLCFGENRISYSTENLHDLKQSTCAFKDQSVVSHNSLKRNIP
jgi:hypothetical protein